MSEKRIKSHYCFDICHDHFFFAYTLDKPPKPALMNHTYKICIVGCIEDFSECDFRIPR